MCASRRPIRSACRVSSKLPVRKQAARGKLLTRRVPFELFACLRGPPRHRLRRRSEAFTARHLAHQFPPALERDRHNGARPEGGGPLADYQRQQADDHDHADGQRTAHEPQHVLAVREERRCRPARASVSAARTRACAAHICADLRRNRSRTISATVLTMKVMHEEEQRRKEQRAVVRAVTHRLGQLDGDVGGQRPETVEDVQSPGSACCRPPSARSWFRPPRGPSPIMMAENSPLIAVGSTMRMAVCQGVAPAPSEAARRWIRHGGERVLRDGVDDGNDGEAHHEAHHQRVALHVGADQARRADRAPAT